MPTVAEPLLANDRCFSARGTARIRAREEMDICEYVMCRFDAPELARVVVGNSISSRRCTSRVRMSGVSSILPRWWLIHMQERSRTERSARGRWMVVGVAPRKSLYLLGESGGDRLRTWTPGRRCKRSSTKSLVMVRGRAVWRRHGKVQGRLRRLTQRRSSAR